MRYLTSCLMLAVAACSAVYAAPTMSSESGPQPINYVPGELVLNPDEYETMQGQQLVVAAPGVLANDSIAPEDASVSLLWGPSHGVLAFSDDGSFVYRPDPGFLGSDEFGYGMADADHQALVTISVIPQSTAPVATNDVFQATEDGILDDPTISVLDNDFDPAGHSLEAVLLSQAGHGEVELQSDGRFIYQPAPDFYGKDSFSYAAINALGDSASASVTIIVHGVNDAPSFEGGADIALELGTQDVTIADWATQISAGPGEDYQELFFQLSVQSDADRILGIVPTLNSNGELTISLVPGQLGTAVLQAVLMDVDQHDGVSSFSAPFEFTITVAYNYVAPSFEALDMVEVQAVAGQEYRIDLAWDIAMGNELNIDEAEFAILEISTPDMFDAMPKIDVLTGELSFVLAHESYNEANLTVVLRSVNGDHQSDARIITILAHEQVDGVLSASSAVAAGTSVAGSDSQEAGCAASAGSKSWLIALAGLGMLFAVCVHRRRTA